MPPYCATWSIVARDPATGQLGVATASRALAVGAWVPNVRPGVAAVCTQSWAKPALAPVLYAALAGGATPDEAIAQALADDDQPGNRQIGVVDRLGRVGAYTGELVQQRDEAQWCGHVAGDGWLVIGNTLAGPEVVGATAAAYEREPEPGWSFGYRLISALAAGEAAGGDHRGKQAAAVLVGQTGDDACEHQPAVDFRVDDHVEPIAELRRICLLACPLSNP